MKRRSVRSEIGVEADRFAKRALARLVLQLAGPCAPVASPPGPIRTILVLSQEKLGDAMLLLPLFGLLKRGLPGVRIVVVIYGPAGACYRFNPHINLVLHGKRNYLALFRQVNRLGVDLLYSPKDHASFTFLYQSRLLAARWRVGLDHPRHHGYFHHVISIDFHTHIALKNCALLDLLGIAYDKEECRPMLPGGPVSPEVAAFAPTIPPQTIGINLSAGERRREWPVERWITLVSRLDVPAVVFGMPDRVADRKRIETACPQVISSPQTDSIDDVGEILRRLTLVVTPDTSLLHAASAVQTPVVGLYRSDPVHVERFGPFRVPNRQVLSATDLVADIPLEAVLAAVRDLSAGGEAS